MVRGKRGGGGGGGGGIVSDVDFRAIETELVRFSFHANFVNSHLLLSFSICCFSSPTFLEDILREL